MYKTPRYSTELVCRRRNVVCSRNGGRRSGFTLLELLIVLAIIVALAAMVAPNLLQSRREANEKTTRATIKNIEDAVKMKAVDNDGEFPEGSQEAITQLAESSTDSQGRERPPYLEEVPFDAWGEPFYYEYDPNRDTTKPRIWSSGANRQDDGGSDGSDDITNWRKEES